MWRGMELHILGAATRKAWAPNERLCRGTESNWLADERVDLAGLWYCKSSVRYGGWPVLRILWTKQASLNRIHHSKMCWLFCTVDWIVLSLLAMWTPLNLPHCIVCWQRACRRRRLRSPRKCRVKLWNDCCGVLRIHLRDWNTASSSTTPRCFVLSRSSTSC